MTAEKPGPLDGEAHRNLGVWRSAVDLAEQVHRLAAQMPDGEGQRLAAQMARAATAVPVGVAQAESASAPASARHRERADAALLELETLLFVSIRLGKVREEQVAACLHAIPRLREMIASPEPVPRTP